jgi:hypothetical protein
VNDDNHCKDITIQLYTAAEKRTEMVATSVTDEEAHNAQTAAAAIASRI